MFHITGGRHVRSDPAVPPTLVAAPGASIATGEATLDHRLDECAGVDRIVPPDRRRRRRCSSTVTPRPRGGRRIRRPRARRPVAGQHDGVPPGSPSADGRGARRSAHVPAAAGSHATGHAAVCLMCEGWSPDEVVAMIDERVADAGFTTLPVRGGESGPAWTYTVGLAGHGHPELVIASVATEVATVVLEEVGTAMLDGRLADEVETRCLPRRPGPGRATSIRSTSSTAHGHRRVVPRSDEPGPGCPISRVHQIVRTRQRLLPRARGVAAGAAPPPHPLRPGGVFPQRAQAPGPTPEISSVSRAGEPMSTRCPDRPAPARRWRRACATSARR